MWILPTQSQRLGRLSRNQHRHNQLTLDILKRFRLIYGSVRHHFRQVEAGCNVSGSQLWLPHELQLAPGIGISELANRLSIRQTTPSQLIEKMAREATC